MDWNHAADVWDALSARVKSRWPQLDLKQIQTIRGDRAALAMALRAAYGYSVDEADAELLAWEGELDTVPDVRSQDDQLAGQADIDMQNEAPDRHRYISGKITHR